MGDGCVNRPRCILKDCTVIEDGTVLAPDAVVSPFCLTQAYLAKCGDCPFYAKSSKNVSRLCRAFSMKASSKRFDVFLLFGAAIAVFVFSCFGAQTLVATVFLFHAIDKVHNSSPIYILIRRIFFV